MLKTPLVPEKPDPHIVGGDYFSTTSPVGNHVWRFDGTSAVRVGVPNPDYRSKAELRAGSTLREALSDVPMFVGTNFTIDLMKLPPGAFYNRIARPSDQHSHQSPGSLPNVELKADIYIGAMNQMRFLTEMLDQVFQTVHPALDNMLCFGNVLRNILILSCTECEAQWRGVLSENSYITSRSNTEDYVKLLPAMRLNEYSVRLRRYPGLNPISPFKDWDAAMPTKSISWYDAYNAVKHDREGSFHRASVDAALQSVAAVWILIAAQFGLNGTRGVNDLTRYFDLVSAPLWPISEVYTYGYDGFTEQAGPRDYQF
ncbi:hypothetical protein J2X48_000914 [Bosea sp. BE271]|uniref:hypothetical protein n=1 Tax=Bosea TaxID=85413 RepID=UPI00285D4353|nr:MULTISPECIES: hypothetical protein [Bosea]MDR6827196.1 hypothetical protein [Bosea robiniae]MDR6893906.1 hypothetical protein [Bosea sp. BE109]MDR7137301.1 hypothetical protein [Bosea sp. BE168]MDR7174001.1 hypothetical protein [Bosea sp. BE271]